MGVRPQPHPTSSGPAYEWPLWSTTMRVVTADPRALSSARRLVEPELAHVELAASRRRRDSEVATLPTGKRTRVSSTLSAILAAALRAASDTEGALDPTQGRALRPVGTTATWRDIDLDETGHTVLVPRGLALDLDVVARAWAADRCAAVVADVLGVGVLVSLGGDIATAGPAGGGAWEVLVGDGPAGGGALVAVPTGLAVVTSLTATSRALRQATVVAASCVSAATYGVAALTGRTGLERLLRTGLPGRLVGVDGAVAYAGGWPPDGELLTGS